MRYRFLGLSFVLSMGGTYLWARHVARHQMVAQRFFESLSQIDPAKLAQALITLSGEEKPPLRFIAGADAVATAEKVAATLQEQTDAYRKLSSSLGYDTP